MVSTMAKPPKIAPRDESRAGKMVVCQPGRMGSGRKSKDTTECTESTRRGGETREEQNTPFRSGRHWRFEPRQPQSEEAVGVFLDGATWRDPATKQDQESGPCTRRARTP